MTNFIPTTSQIDGPPPSPAKGKGLKFPVRGEPALVLIESPYAGDVERNETYARRCLKDSLDRGEAPFASHLLYTQPGVLDDTIQVERDKGIVAGLTWGKKAALTAVYADYGISSGMELGISWAASEGRSVEFRRIGRNP